MKTCLKCGVEKAFDAYHKGKGPGGRHSWCKSCIAVARLQWDKDNPTRKRDQALWTKYRLRPHEFEAMLTAQNNLCAICHLEFGPARAANVDHDHNCCNSVKSCGNCVRGLLCKSCNTKLGWIDKHQSSVDNYRAKYASIG